MDPDYLLKVLVEIIKALYTRQVWCVLPTCLPNDSHCDLYKEHPTSFERKLILKLHDFVLQLGADHPRPCGRFLSPFASSA